MSIGTGEELNEITQALYSKEWAIIVTDTTGTAPIPVANETLQASIRSVRFHKGQMVVQGPDDDWSPFPYAATCDDEDTNRDGFLDLAAGAPLPAPVTLAAIKSDPAFRDFALVRISRLSVMPVPPALAARILVLARA